MTKGMYLVYFECDKLHDAMKWYVRDRRVNLRKEENNRPFHTTFQRFSGPLSLLPKLEIRLDEILKGDLFFIEPNGRIVSVGNTLSDHTTALQMDYTSSQDMQQASLEFQNYLSDCEFYDSLEQAYLGVNWYPHTSIAQTHGYWDDDRREELLRILQIEIQRKELYQIRPDRYVIEFKEEMDLPWEVLSIQDFR